jgi:branched-chain amino acid transport system permease protein
MNIFIPNLEQFLQATANALTIGSLYASVAIGYTMVYGILRLINFAHGDIIMMSMYFAFYLSSLFLLPWYISFIVAIIGIGLLGILIEKVAYRPMRSAPRISLLISAIGVSYLMENFATVVFSGIPKQFPSVPFFQETIVIGFVHIQRLSLIVPVITAALVIVLIVIVNKTKIGMAMRATSRDFDTARLMGIRIDRVISVTFCIGSVLAAIGALMWGLKYPKIEPYVGIMPGIKCFIAAVLGGIGNIVGAVIGAMILGFIEVMVVLFFPGLSGYKDAFAFILLIIILLVRPTGILGEKIIDKA